MFWIVPVIVCGGYAYYKGNQTYNKFQATSEDCQKTRAAAVNMMNEVQEDVRPLLENCNKLSRCGVRVKEDANKVISITARRTEQTQDKMNHLVTKLNTTAYLFIGLLVVGLLSLVWYTLSPPVTLSFV